MKYNIILNFIFAIFCQITIVFIFLVIFYFNYVALVEKKTFLKQFDNLLDSLLNETGILPIPETKANAGIRKELDQLVANIKTKNANSNKSIIQKNEQLEKISMNMVFISVGSFLLYTLIISLTKHKLAIKSVVYESILTLVVIALTEYLFLQIVVKNYKSADPNYVKHAIAQSIQTYADKQPTTKPSTD
tara:strand:+ start:292 stop:861 length:570 start_codon:yes stop_codon:yes gene_type:complete